LRRTIGRAGEDKVSAIEKIIKNKERIEQLERKAAEKAGMRFLFFEEEKAMGKEGNKYIRRYIERLIEDLKPEILEAAKLGKETYGEIEK